MIASLIERSGFLYLSTRHFLDLLLTSDEIFGIVCARSDFVDKLLILIKLDELVDYFTWIGCVMRQLWKAFLSPKQW